MIDVNNFLKKLKNFRNRLRCVHIFDSLTHYYLCDISNMYKQCNQIGKLCFYVVSILEIYSTNMV